MTFNPGSSYTVPIGGATLDFGSIVLGGSGGSVLTSADDCFSFVPRSDEPGYNLSSGSVWVHIGAALCGPVCVGVDAVAGAVSASSDVAQLRTASATAPAATFTLTVASHHRHILHVISGAVKLTSTYHGVKMSAGSTVSLTPSGGHRSVSSWPAAAQKLVPAGQRPPDIHRLTLKGRRATFMLSERAKLAVKVVKGKHTLATRKARGHKGANSIRLGKRPARGTTLEVIATDSGGRVTEVRERVH